MNSNYCIISSHRRRRHYFHDDDNDVSSARMQRRRRHHHNHGHDFSTFPTSNSSYNDHDDVKDDNDNDADSHSLGHGDATTTSNSIQHNNKHSNTTIISSSSSSSNHHCPHRHRLSNIRNVGIFAHVDAGKTTVTERMLALSGMVRHPGSVDGGDTVTDYLPAERERGITIQSAAVGFEWRVPPSSSSKLGGGGGGTGAAGTAAGGGMAVSINLIDTPGHVDFSVEVHRSVAVLDGAILVVDAVAGAQAQTETVWRAIRNDANSNNGSSIGREGRGNDNRNNNDANSGGAERIHGTHAHEPLPALMFVNKMDREGADFQYAIQSVKSKLRGSNPVPIQIPLYLISSSSHRNGAGGGVIVANNDHGEYIGLVDLVHMRAIIYPTTNSESLSVEDAAPLVINLLGRNATSQKHQAHHDLSPSVVDAALDARRELISHLANIDEIMEDSYLIAMMNQEEEKGHENTISTEEIQSSLRRMTLARRIMPTMCGAALRGLGVEPVLDCVAEYCK